MGARPVFGFVSDLPARFSLRGQRRHAVLPPARDLEWTIWWGGHSFGYRLLIEMLPALTILLALAWEKSIRERPAWKWAFLACLAWSFFIQAFGARSQPTGFNEKLDENRSVLWSPGDSDPVLAIRKAFPGIAGDPR